LLLNQNPDYLTDRIQRGKRKRERKTKDERKGETEQAGRKEEESENRNRYDLTGIRYSLPLFTECKEGESIPSIKTL